MKRIGLLYHPWIPETKDLAEELCRQLDQACCAPWAVSAWDEEAIRKRAAGLDCLITFGGDGTILRAARATAGRSAPILGINFGRLGFLAELQPDEAVAHIPLLLEGRYRLEERAMLHCTAQRDGDVMGSYEALNDITVGRGALAKAVRLATYVDSELLTTYVADAVLVSTATGSTAYSLAAGGPILAPGLRNLLITPVAPHLTPARSLVLPAEAVVEVVINTDYDATLTIDGQIDMRLQDADSIITRISSHSVMFVRFGQENHFYGTLLERLR